MWLKHEVADTAYAFIRKDPSFASHADLPWRFAATTDSVRTELLRLVDGCPLSDVAYVKLHTSRYGKKNGLDSMGQRGTGLAEVPHSGEVHLLRRHMPEQVFLAIRHLLK